MSLAQDAPSAGMPVAPARKKSVLASVIFRLLWLPGLLKQAYMARKKGDQSKAVFDHELSLYADMFPSGFLHYGYFTDPDIRAEHISFGALDDAQVAYANKLVEKINDQDNPVLDVGCGMGGISFMLGDEGYQVVALTPDRHQANYIRTRKPDLPLIENTFESFPADDYHHYFGSILTSESLQYLDLDESLPKIRQLLKPGGLWVACDYFRMNPQETSSGHVWKDFCSRLEANGFRIRSCEDITHNILPTLKFASLMAERFIKPAYKYAEAKTRSKSPVLHYIFEGLFERISGKLKDGSRTIDSTTFMNNKRYYLLVMEIAPRTPA